MKKTILFLLTLCLLLGAAIPAFADAPAADSLDSHLILHYDFEARPWMNSFPTKPLPASPTIR